MICSFKKTFLFKHNGLARKKNNASYVLYFWSDAFFREIRLTDLIEVNDVGHTTFFIRPSRPQGNRKS